MVTRCKGQGQRYLRGGRQHDVEEERNKSSHNSATIALRDIKQDKESIYSFILKIVQYVLNTQETTANKINTAPLLVERVIL